MIAECAGKGLDELEDLADDEARVIRRFERHTDRVIEHQRRRPGCTCNPGGVWDFITESDGLEEDHDWTLRILRRARRAALRSERVATSVATPAGPRAARAARSPDFAP